MNMYVKPGTMKILMKSKCLFVEKLKKKSYKKRRKVIRKEEKL